MSPAEHEIRGALARCHLGGVCSLGSSVRHDRRYGSACWRILA
jgi:hypothetical protein